VHTTTIMSLHYLVKYFGVDTLKDVFENVVSRNVIAYVKDINFYICI